MNTGYTKRVSKNYLKELALDVELTLKFIKSTQKEEWNKFKGIYKESSDEKFIKILFKEIEFKGTIHVLRNGFKDVGPYFKLFYPMPNNNRNPELFNKFESNIFSVIDKLEYDDDNNNRLDLAIFINGLPILAIELKNNFSQGIEEAIKQYKRDRNPRNRTLKNCLVHFAMSDEKIYMSTKLNNDKTRFLPFNRGSENPAVKDIIKLHTSIKISCKKISYLNLFLTSYLRKKKQLYFLVSIN